MRRIPKQIQQPFVRVRVLFTRSKRWWLRNDQRYGRLRWRIGNALAATLLLFTAALPVIQLVAAGHAYALTAATEELVGVPDPGLSKQLTYDSTTRTYSFNKSAIKDTNANPAAALQAQIGTATGQGDNKSLYALDVPQDIAKGVTYHDINSGLSFSLVPQFGAREGRVVNGHLVFPLGGGKQAIYTLKNSGLKEDIVLQKATSDHMTFTYQLNLPKTLETKVIPDSGGAIGIYSGDPALYGNISYTTDADRANVEKARENAAKTYLVFGLPAPVIKNTAGDRVGTGRFELHGSQLSVIASGLSHAKGPITIDPSVVVSSTGDFLNGNFESNADSSTSGQVTRGGLSGGAPTTWVNGTSFSGQRGTPALVAYNGFMYLYGGDGDTDVQYATINSSTGALGAWQSAGPNMLVGRRDFAYFAYNGYLYALGGTDTNFSSLYNDVSYAPINSDGTVGTWKETTNFASGRLDFNAFAYNGYAYVIGGYNFNGVTAYNDTQYAPIRADGTLGAWTTAATTFTNPRGTGGAAAYNGFIYVVGGYDGCCSSLYNDVQYAPINADGSIGTWTTNTTSFTNGRSDFHAIISNGYMYVMGGYRSGAQSDFQYAPINANGSVGTWRRLTGNLSPARYAYGAAAYNGYLYLAGGDNTTQSVNSTRYVKIDTAGQLVPWTTDTTHPITARANVCAVASNKYMYTIGGSTSDDGNNNLQTVGVATLNTTTGLASSFSESSALPAGGRGSVSCAISNNNILYISGGFAGASGGTRDSTTFSAPLNLSTGAVGTFTPSTHNITDISTNFKPISAGLFIYNNYIYSIGGDYSSGTSPVNAQGVYYAPLDPSTGAIGTWVQSAHNLTTSYFARGFARVGNHVYALGGRDGVPNDTTSVEMATISSSGDISAWTTSNITPLTTAVAYAHATTINGCIYLVGGETVAAGSVNTVVYNCPASDGTLPNPWKSAPNLATATTDMAVANYGGYLYGIAGYTTGVTGTVNVAPVNNGGSGQIGTWSSQSGKLPQTMEAFGSTAYNGYMYIAGGRGNSGADLNLSSYAQINSDGSLGTMTSGPTFSATKREGLKMVAANGYLYLMGGNNYTFSTYYSDVFSAPIGTNGSIGSWTQLSASPLASARDPGCTTTNNNYIYTVGGFGSGGSLTDVLYAQAGSNGTLNGGAAWSTGTSLPTADAGFCFVANNYLYVIGDHLVYSAPVNTNGSIGSWSTTSSSPEAQGGSGGTPNGAWGVADGFVYELGGCIDSNGDCTGSAGTTATQFAPIEPGGTLGTWQTSTALSAGWGMGSGFAANGYVYQFGGYNDGALYSDTVFYAPISVMDRTGTYTKLVDLGAANNVTSVTYSGTLPLGSSVTYRAAGADGVFGSSTATSSISGATGGCIGTQNTTRYLFLTVVLSDAQAGANFFADPSPSDPASDFPAQLNDVTVNYNYFKPPPNVRLRGGQTLQSGNLTAFDTCLSSITHLQSATFTENTPANPLPTPPPSLNSVAINMPSVGAGHLLVATVVWGLGTGTPACSDTLGNSWTTLVLGNDATNGASVAVCYAATTGSGNDTITAGSLGNTYLRAITVDEYSGVLINAGAPQLDGSATHAVTTGTTGVSNSITTTLAGDLIFGAVGITSTANPVISAAGSFSLRAANGVNAMLHAANEDFVQGAAGSTSASWNFNGTSSAYLAGVIAFKAAPRH